MTDDRPRPQYGEYATPEQQAAAMGKRPIPPLRVQPEMPAAAAAPPPTSPPARFASDGTPLPSSPPNPVDRVDGRGLPRHHPVDRIVTIVLLALGLYSLLDNFAAYQQFGTLLMQYAVKLGQTYSPPAAAAAQAGHIIFALNIGLFLATLVLSVRTVRSGRIAFYIPIIGNIVFSVASLITIITVVPTFYNMVQNYVASQ